VRGAALALLVVLACPARDAHAQLFVATGRDTLRRLPGVEVVVEPLQPEIESVVLTGSSLGTDVTARLRDAGVAVYATQRENAGPSKAYLYVHVNAASAQDGRLWAVAVQVHLRQTMASTVTESKVVDAMTWDAHDVIIVQPSQAGRAIREIVGSLVGRFIDDWKTVH